MTTEPMTKTHTTVTLITQAQGADGAGPLAYSLSVTEPQHNDPNTKAEAERLAREVFMRRYADQWTGEIEQNWAKFTQTYSVWPCPEAGCELWSYVEGGACWEHAPDDEA